MSKGLEALKRIRQETCPATYMPDFDKEECCNIIEKELKALEIIKKFVWVENGEIHLGLYGDSEIVLRENDFESKEEYDLLKKIRALESWKYLCENGHVDIPTPKRK